MVRVFVFLSFALLTATGLVFNNYSYFQRLEVTDMSSRLIPPPENIKLMSFGYDDNLADSLWLSWLQFPEECGKEKIARSVFESQSPLYNLKNKNALNIGKEKWGRDTRPVCDKGWSFLMLDAITKLAPKFRWAYLTGGSLLSIMVDDHEGAGLLYDRAVENFPNDWKLNYYAAYHFLFELDDLEKAAKLLLQAAENGAPEWTRSLAARLYDRMGQTVLAIIALKEYLIYLEKMDNKSEIVKVKERIANLEREIERAKRQKESFNPKGS